MAFPLFLQGLAMPPNAAAFRQGRGPARMGTDTSWSTTATPAATIARLRNLQEPQRAYGATIWLEGRADRERPDVARSPLAPGLARADGRNRTSNGRESQSGATARRCAAVCSSIRPERQGAATAARSVLGRGHLGLQGPSKRRRFQGRPFELAGMNSVEAHLTLRPRTRTIRALPGRSVAMAVYSGPGPVRRDDRTVVRRYGRSP